MPLSPCPGSWTNGKSLLGNMPVFVVESALSAAKPTVILNEGSVKSYDLVLFTEVIDRLDWIKDVLG